MKLSTLVLIILGLLNFVVCNQGAIASETQKVESVPIQPKNQQNLSGRRNIRDVQNQNSDKQNSSRNSSEINDPSFLQNCSINNNQFNIGFNLPDRGAPKGRGEGEDSSTGEKDEESPTVPTHAE